MKLALASAAALCATVLAVGVDAQSTGMAPVGKDKMSQDTMGRKDVSYTGCVETGKAPRTYVLTRVAADEHMGKDAMATDSMGSGAMAQTTLDISSQAVDLSKYVGRKVAVSGTAPGNMAAMKDTMAGDAMASHGPAFTVKTLKTIASTCQ